jgi:hypothetical protein
MDVDKPPYNPVQEAISLLESMRSYIQDDAELMWTSYQSTVEVRQEIDGCMEGIRKLDLKAIERAATFFIPTGDFQNMALDSGWGDVFLIFAERYDKVYVELKELAKNRTIT